MQAPELSLKELRKLITQAERDSSMHPLPMLYFSANLRAFRESTELKPVDLATILGYKSETPYRRLEMFGQQYVEYYILKTRKTVPLAPKLDRMWQTCQILGLNFHEMVSSKFLEFDRRASFLGALKSHSQVSIPDFYKRYGGKTNDE